MTPRHARLVIVFAAGTVVACLGDPSVGDTPSPRLQFQYLDGTIRVPAAREDEPRRDRISYEKAVDYLDEGAIAWQNEHGCITCHTNGSYLLTRPVLSDRFGPPRPEVRAFFESQLREASKDPRRVPPEQSVYLAAGLATDDAYVRKEHQRLGVRLLQHFDRPQQFSRSPAAAPQLGQ